MSTPPSGLDIFDLFDHEVPGHQVYNMYCHETEDQTHARHFFFMYVFRTILCEKYISFTCRQTKPYQCLYAHTMKNRRRVPVQYANLRWNYCAIPCIHVSLETCSLDCPFAHRAQREHVFHPTVFKTQKCTSTFLVASPCPGHCSLNHANKKPESGMGSTVPCIHIICEDYDIQCTKAHSPSDFRHYKLSEEEQLQRNELTKVRAEQISQLSQTELTELYQLGGLSSPHTFTYAVKHNALRLLSTYVLPKAPSYIPPCFREAFAKVLRNANIYLTSSGTSTNLDSHDDYDHTSSKAEISADSVSLLPLKYDGDSHPAIRAIEHHDPHHDRQPDHVAAQPTSTQSLSPQQSQPQQPPLKQQHPSQHQHQHQVAPGEYEHAYPNQQASMPGHAPPQAAPPASSGSRAPQQHQNQRQGNGNSLPLRENRGASVLDTLKDRQTPQGLFMVAHVCNQDDCPYRGVGTLKSSQILNTVLAAQQPSRAVPGPTDQEIHHILTGAINPLDKQSHTLGGLVQHFKLYPPNPPPVTHAVSPHQILTDFRQRGDAPEYLQQLNNIPDVFHIVNIINTFMQQVVRTPIPSFTTPPPSMSTLSNHAVARHAQGSSSAALPMHANGASLANGTPPQDHLSPQTIMKDGVMVAALREFQVLLDEKQAIESSFHHPPQANPDEYVCPKEQREMEHFYYMFFYKTQECQAYREARKEKKPVRCSCDGLDYHRPEELRRRDVSAYYPFYCPDIKGNASSAAGWNNPFFQCSRSKHYQDEYARYLSTQKLWSGGDASAHGASLHQPFLDAPTSAPSVSSMSSSSSRRKGKKQGKTMPIHCDHAHTLMELMYHPLTYKTTLCTNFDENDPSKWKCSWKRRCAHAHGVGDLRTSNDVSSIRYIPHSTVMTILHRAQHNSESAPPVASCGGKWYFQFSSNHSIDYLRGLFEMSIPLIDRPHSSHQQQYKYMVQQLQQTSVCYQHHLQQRLAYRAQQRQLSRIITGVPHPPHNGGSGGGGDIHDNRLGSNYQHDAQQHNGYHVVAGNPTQHEQQQQHHYVPSIDHGSQSTPHHLGVGGGGQPYALPYGPQPHTEYIHQHEMDHPAAAAATHNTPHYGRHYLGQGSNEQQHYRHPPSYASGGISSHSSHTSMPSQTFSHAHMQGTGISPMIGRVPRHQLGMPMPPPQQHSQQSGNNDTYHYLHGSVPLIGQTHGGHGTNGTNHHQQPPPSSLSTAPSHMSLMKQSSVGQPSHAYSLQSQPVQSIHQPPNGASLGYVQQHFLSHPYLSGVGPALSAQGVQGPPAPPQQQQQQQQIVANYLSHPSETSSSSFSFAHESYDANSLRSAGVGRAPYPQHQSSGQSIASSNPPHPQPHPPHAIQQQTVTSNPGMMVHTPSSDQHLHMHQQQPHPHPHHHQQLITSLMGLSIHDANEHNDHPGINPRVGPYTQQSDDMDAQNNQHVHFLPTQHSQQGNPSLYSHDSGSQDPSLIVPHPLSPHHLDPSFSPSFNYPPVFDPLFPQSSVSPHSSSHHTPSMEGSFSSQFLSKNGPYNQ